MQGIRCDRECACIVAAGNGARQPGLAEGFVWLSSLRGLLMLRVTRVAHSQDCLWAHPRR